MIYKGFPIAMSGSSDASSADAAMIEARHNHPSHDCATQGQSLWDLAKQVSRKNEGKPSLKGAVRRPRSGTYLGDDVSCFAGGGWVFCGQPLNLNCQWGLDHGRLIETKKAYPQVRDTGEALI